MSIDYREIYKLLKERPAGFEERINASQLGKREVLDQFRTIRIGGPRQTGMTEFIIEAMQEDPNSYCLVPNEGIARVFEFKGISRTRVLTHEEACDEMDCVDMIRKPVDCLFVEQGSWVRRDLYLDWAIKFMNSNGEIVVVG